jgi:L-asparagine transporter-like permease
MNFFRFLHKLSNILFIPFLFGVVCILLFEDELNTFEYGQTIYYILLIVCIIGLVGALMKKKVRNEKNN